MKRAILLLLLLLSLKAKSQNYLGYNRSELVSLYYKEHKDETYETEWKRSDGGIEYVVFKDGEIYKAYYFHPSDGHCYSYVICYPYRFLNDVVERMNKNYVREAEFSWIDYNQNIDFRWSIQKENSFFIVKCEEK